MALYRQRRKRQTFLAGAAIAVVVVVVAVLVVLKLTGSGSSPTAVAVTGNGPVALSTYEQLTSVGVSTLAAAAKHYTPAMAAYPQVTNDPPITTSAKPVVLYLGAEYCPYCATERWPLILALSKLGTFHGLTAIHSSPTDVYPNTPSFSFYHSTYTSPYLTFTPVEEETVNYKPLQTPTPAENAIAAKYDTSQSIPFMYFNGKAILSGAEYDPKLLAGKSVPQVAAAIAAGTSPLANSVDANAGTILSDLCRMTRGKPGSVCKLFPTPITS